MSQKSPVVKKDYEPGVYVIVLKGGNSYIVYPLDDKGEWKVKPLHPKYEKETVFTKKVGDLYFIGYPLKITVDTKGMHLECSLKRLQYSVTRV